MMKESNWDILIVKCLALYLEIRNWITLGLDIVTELDSLDEPCDSFNDGKLEGLLLGDSLGYTDRKLLGSDEGIKLLSTDGKMLGTIRVNVYGITLGLDVGTELGFLDGSFYGSNGGKLGGLFIVDSLGYTDGKLLGSAEGTAWAVLTW